MFIIFIQEALAYQQYPAEGTLSSNVTMAGDVVQGIKNMTGRNTTLAETGIKMTKAMAMPVMKINGKRTMTQTDNILHTVW